jgi:uncharacterized membrane protein YqiK
MRVALVWSVIGAIVLFVLAGYGGPRYQVYVQRKMGEARLAEAESSRKIAIQEAEAKMESAKMLAAAEVERARGVAEANKIIGESLQNNESYLRYLWINNMDDQGATIVYIPTEAGMPILEAGRLKLE